METNLTRREFLQFGKANLLLNTGPLPDGSIHPDDVKTLREVGARIRANGFPAPAAPAAPAAVRKRNAKNTKPKPPAQSDSE